jgi:hypothetical protein
MTCKIKETAMMKLKWNYHFLSTTKGTYTGQFRDQLESSVGPDRQTHRGTLTLYIYNKLL